MNPRVLPPDINIFATGGMKRALWCALFVIDSEGVIRWSYVSPVGINPGADGILRALESLVQGQGQSGTAGLHRPQNRGMV